ncbi:hypothetical protein ACMA1D_00625 [Streptomyces sp. 796.1]|uniref:hypothetical protein n=1 Tax=Streptomyces sp. 796.1 TaxID=3163029 RepID=UPI0039C97796
MAMAVVCSAAAVAGAHDLTSRVGERSAPVKKEQASPAGMGDREGEFVLFEPVWTTAHIYQKGINNVAHDTGLVVSYVGPTGRNPHVEEDWIGIYEYGKLDKEHRKDWDYVCPNEKERCKAFGSAIVPAGNDGLESGKKYTVAYWLGSKGESGRAPAVTIDYVVPW